jgi:hypothetical protein
MRLRMASELFPEIIDGTLDAADDMPSCSTLEAVQRQEAFVNQTIANHALALLGRLFRYGTVSYHGGFVNLGTGACTPLRIDPRMWRRLRRRMGS